MWTSYQRYWLIHIHLYLFDSEPEDASDFEKPRMSASQWLIPNGLTS